MKNMTLLSIIAASLLFTACGEKTKEAATDAAKTVTEAIKEDTAAAVDAVKETAAEAKEAVDEAVETAKAGSEKVVEAAVAAKEVTSEKAAEAAEALKERAAAATEAASETVEETVAPAKQAPAAEEAEAVSEAAPVAAVENEAGKTLYTKCVACHGADGKTKALGKSAVIAGQNAADLEASISEYKAGTRNVAGMGMLMKGQVAGLSDEDIKAVAAYISTL